MAKRAAQGAGTIRKKTVTRNGKEYTYWEARITIGRDPGTGKQIQRSFSGKTQKEVREKMQAAAVEVNTGTYIAPQKLTVGQWLDMWQEEYLINLKATTKRLYSSYIRNHIRPALGALKLTDLHPHTVQTFINSLELASGTVHLTYKVLHTAMEQAVKLDYIQKNPSATCILPKLEQQQIHPLEDEQIAALLYEVKGKEIENIVAVALFAGMRVSEILGLTWDSIDFEKHTITVDKQLIRNSLRDGKLFTTPKSGKSRRITAANSVMVYLRSQRARQAEMQLKAGQLWNNEHNLVFTLEDGSPYNQFRVTKLFKASVKKIGLESTRFHDLRHTYAVNSIRAGDDIKTIQSNLGHASAAFTLDKYGHFTEQMKQDSATRMENFIKGVLNL